MPTAVEDVELSLRRTDVPRRAREARARELLSAAGLGALADRSVREASSGQRQLLALTSVLATGPRVLLCDEPTTLLDLRTARRVTDALSEVVDTSEVRPLDVYAVISVRSAATDYLPTTLRSFLAVDDGLVDLPRPSGDTPVESLMEQLDALEDSATAVLQAVREQDVDALMTQGAFLRTKFTRSDLDL